MNSQRGAPPAAGNPPGGAANAEYTLKLFVSGQTLRSTVAIENIRRICDDHLAGRYRLDVVDIYQHPMLAQQAQIVAAPTLLKMSPEPPRRIIGDLSDTQRVLSALGLRPRGAAYGS